MPLQWSSSCEGHPPIISIRLPGEQSHADRWFDRCADPTPTGPAPGLAGMRVRRMNEVISSMTRTRIRSSSLPILFSSALCQTILHCSIEPRDADCKWARCTAQPPSPRPTWATRTTRNCWVGSRAATPVQWTVANKHGSENGLQAGAAPPVLDDADFRGRIQHYGAGPLDRVDDCVLPACWTGGDDLGISLY